MTRSICMMLVTYSVEYSGLVQAVQHWVATAAACCMRNSLHTTQLMMLHACTDCTAHAYNIASHILNAMSCLHPCCYQHRLWHTRPQAQLQLVYPASNPLLEYCWFKSCVTIDWDQGTHGCQIGYLAGSYPLTCVLQTSKHLSFGLLSTWAWIP